MRDLKFVIFKDQKYPLETDKRYEGKKQCVIMLYSTVIPKSQRMRYRNYFATVVDPSQIV